MSSEAVRPTNNRVLRLVDGADDGEGSPPSELPMSAAASVDPVVVAADRRIKQRGLADLRDIVEQMVRDPSYAPDPIDVIEAGALAQDGLLDNASTSEFHEM